MSHRIRAVTAAIPLLATLIAPVPATSLQEELGRAVYDQWCAACHGVAGDGLGPAAGYMLPRPRDFTRGLYQIRTTAGGEIPTDADLLHMINEGMPGTAMPGWESQLSRREREALVDYLKSFYPPFASLPPPTPLDFGRAPRANPERIAEGREFYDRIECWQCHGDTGRGYGTSAPTLEDDWGDPIRAVDLTKNWLFDGGGSVEDIYRRLRTGLDGTPMPSFSDLVDAEFMTDDQLWSLAHYVRSLAPDREPRVREVIRVERTESELLPTSLDDERWEEVESFFIPLVGQILVSPRWFDPSIDAVWVQGMHDGEEFVLRITWHDPSRSPDPAWAPWQERILEVMEPHEGDPVEPGPRPDRFAIQLPLTIPVGLDRPYFFMGDARTPVSLWQWASDQPEVIARARARGVQDIEEVPGGVLASEARWSEGR